MFMYLLYLSVFLFFLLQEREKSVEYWRLKYAADTAKINELLAEKREQLRVTVARREELQALVVLVKCFVS